MTQSVVFRLKLGLGLGLEFGFSVCVRVGVSVRVKRLLVIFSQVKCILTHDSFPHD